MPDIDNKRIHDNNNYQAMKCKYMRQFAIKMVAAEFATSFYGYETIHSHSTEESRSREFGPIGK